MKVTIEAVMEGKVVIGASAEVATFADLAKLGKTLTTKVAGVKRFMPDMANAKVENVRIAKE